MSAARVRADRCPGVLRLLDAADGKLARVRLPGGVVTTEALRALADVAEDLGDGRLELTSRGNVQVRGLAAGAGERLSERLFNVGLLPSATHEHVRNVVSSPLSGIDTERDVTPLVERLDLVLMSDPTLAELSGRFAFAVDDGRGDVGTSGADVLCVVRGARAWVEGLDVPLADAADTMADAARAFLAERMDQASTAWHVDDLLDGRARVRARLGAPGDADPDVPPVPPRPIGIVQRADGGTALVVAAPLGRLTAAQARWLAEHSVEPLRVTPWRRIVVPHAPAADPTDVGLVVDPTSPWLSVSACAGKPRCAEALADVQHDAADDLARWAGRRVHWSGCERRCGRTNDVEVDVVATTDGYEIETTGA